MPDMDKVVPPGKDVSEVMARALEGVQDHATIMVGGFGMPGAPAALLDALLTLNRKHLTIIKNEANEPGMGVSRLIEAGQVDRIVLSHLGLNSVVIEMMNRGEVAVEFHPQGILAEKIRCGGAGLPGFLTDIGVDTIIADQRQVMEFQGRQVIVEPGLRADVALLHAHTADRLGNLVYARTARNFNPLMAQAADLVIVEALHVVETGSLDPDAIHTPCAFVDRVVDLGGQATDSYRIMEHHVRQA